MDLIPEVVRQQVPESTPDEAAALADWYAGLQRGLAAFPSGDVRGVEPPLRSTPGPT